VIDKHPVVIQSYLDFWTYLNSLYKSKKHSKRAEQKQLNGLLNQLKSIT